MIPQAQLRFDPKRKFPLKSTWNWRWWKRTWFFESILGERSHLSSFEFQQLWDLKAAIIVSRDGFLNFSFDVEVEVELKWIIRIPFKESEGSNRPCSYRTKQWRKFSQLPRLRSGTLEEVKVGRHSKNPSIHTLIMESHWSEGKQWKSFWWPFVLSLPF